MKLFLESQMVKMDHVFFLEDDKGNPDDEIKDIICDDSGDEELLQDGETAVRQGHLREQS